VERRERVIAELDKQTDDLLEVRAFCTVRSLQAAQTRRAAQAPPNAVTRPAARTGTS
jgi:hypothetical protein